MEVANCYNNFFVNMAQRTLQNNQPNTTPPTYHNLHQVNVNGFYFHHATQIKIEKAIDTLKPKPHPAQTTF